MGHGALQLLDRQKGLLLMRAARGVTLIELVVVIAVMALLAVMTAPAIGSWIANARMRSVAESLQNTLRLAQQEAVRRNRQTVFVLTNATPSLTATPVANGNNWFVRALPLVATETVDPTFYVQGTANTGQSVAITGPAIVCFNSLGRPVANASTGLGSNCAAPTDVTYDITRTGADRRLRVQLSFAGRIRMCDRDKTLSTGNPDGC